MLKTSILNYQSYLKNVSWVTLWFILFTSIPAFLFALLLIFETEIAALLMTLYPPSGRQGFVFFQDLVFLARIEILWIGFFLLLTLVLAVYPSRTALQEFLNLRTRSKGIFYMMLIASAFFFTTLVTASHALEYFANSSDEYAYLFQAEMFSRDKLWERAPDLPDFFHLNNIAQHDGILLSRFPPGWPLILSVAFEAGIAPYLINPLLGLITLVVFYFFCKTVLQWPGGSLVLAGHGPVCVLYL